MPSSLYRVIGKDLATRFDWQQSECQEWDISKCLNKKQIKVKEEIACREYDLKAREPYMCPSHVEMEKYELGKGNLNELQPMHGEDRQYSCDECGESFSQQVILRAHRCMHSEEQLICCD
ncbi:zinc finger protein 425-like, partial [Cryptotermes secundus]|uniref:zinc finger protein 425-like n=1 Tax=Cryptotermes secundus TaxID=105785 RepID=UPI000CD7B104